jgi:ADP-ribose pyrophosphatase
VAVLSLLLPEHEYNTIELSDIRKSIFKYCIIIVIILAKVKKNKMLPTKENPWAIEQKQIVYQNYWIIVTHHDVVHQQGGKGVYGTVHFKNLAIGIIVLDEYYNTWLVGQFRFPVNQYTWEIPEGGGKLNVLPLESAKRELLEEAGIEAMDWRLIQELQLSNSATDERAYIFLARQLHFTTACPDKNETLHQRKIPFNDAYKMVLNGEITDSLSVVAILKIQIMMLNGEL